MQACKAFLAEERPRQVAALAAAAAALAEEAMLLEDSLRNGMYTDAALGAAGEVLADLEVVAERLRQMQVGRWLSGRRMGGPVGAPPAERARY